MDPRGSGTAPAVVTSVDRCFAGLCLADSRFFRPGKVKRFHLLEWKLSAGGYGWGQFFPIIRAMDIVPRSARRWMSLLPATFHES